MGLLPMNPPNKSSKELSGFGVDHAESDAMSKLKGLELVSAVAGMAWYAGAESNAEAKEVNMGLLAIVVNPVLGLEELGPACPNPKSICIAPSVAVGCGVSSSRLNMAGSNVVSELQSNGFVFEDPDDEDGPEDDTGGDCNDVRGDVELNAVSEADSVDFGTVKVNAGCLFCLSATFSF